MDKLIKIILIFLTSLILNSCGNMKDFVTNTKASGGEEFLVEKKQPLTLPPNFDEIPKPIAELEDVTNQTEEDIDGIDSLLKDISEETTSSSEKVFESLEKSILEKIN
tara:strand:+ start:304 stop:627 length:324 start_codon:yes stop_codon:yes gene_type:complete